MAFYQKISLRYLDNTQNLFPLSRPQASSPLRITISQAIAETRLRRELEAAEEERLLEEERAQAVKDMELFRQAQEEAKTMAAHLGIPQPEEEYLAGIYYRYLKGAKSYRIDKNLIYSKFIH